MLKLVGIFILAIAVVAHGSTTNPPHTSPTTTPTTTPQDTSSPPTTTTAEQQTTTAKQETTTASTVTTPEPPVTTPTEHTTTSSEAPTVHTTASSEGSTTEPNTTHAATTGGEVTTASEATTTMTPSPTPPPTPASPSEPWIVNSTDDTVCIVMTLGARMLFNYTDKNNKNNSAWFDLPVNASAMGSCNTTGTVGQFIKLTFHTNWTLQFNFEQKDEKVYVSTVTVVYDLDPDVFMAVSKEDEYEIRTATAVNQTLFRTQKSSNSYVCNAESNITLHDNVEITTANVQVQAFRTGKDEKFGTSEQCPADATTSNIVPIAVGAALAALVVIVLIAYLISRNKNKGGYESV